LFQDFVLINKTPKKLFHFLFLEPWGPGAGAPQLIRHCPQDMSR